MSNQKPSSDESGCLVGAIAGCFICGLAGALLGFGHEGTFQGACAGAGIGLTIPILFCGIAFFS